MIGFSERVKTLIVDEITGNNGDLWLFQIEIFKHSQKGYFATLYRWDSYEIAPTFAVQKGWIASESFFIDDSFRFDGLGLYGDERKYFANIDVCQSYVLKCIDDAFNL